MFCFVSIILPLSAGALPRHVFTTFDRVGVPTAKSLDDERDENDPLGAAIVKVGSILRRLAHLDGGAGKFGGPEDDGVLRGRDDADVEGDLPSIDP